MAKAARGMLVAFIDFPKAYNKVDRGKMWGCLEQLGVNGSYLRFLKACSTKIAHVVELCDFSALSHVAPQHLFINALYCKHCANICVHILQYNACP